MQYPQFIIFNLSVASVTARSFIRLVRLLKNVPDCDSFFSKLISLLSGAASGAEMSLCLREKASDANASAVLVALDHLTPAASKRAVTQMGRSFRRLIDDASNVQAAIRFAGLTATNTP